MSIFNHSFTDPPSSANDNIALSLAELLDAGIRYWKEGILVPGFAYPLLHRACWAGDLLKHRTPMIRFWSVALCSLLARDTADFSLSAFRDHQESIAGVRLLVFRLVRGG